MQQVRRRYLSFDREEGEEVVRIKGNVHKKTMQGRAAQPSAYRLTIYRYAIIVSFSSMAKSDLPVSNLSMYLCTNSLSPKIFQNIVKISLSHFFFDNITRYLSNQHTH